MKIVADQQIPHLQAFSKFAEVSICEGREITAESVRDTDVLLVRSVTPVNASLLEGSQVKFVATATSGQNHIDLDYLQSKKIGFAHAKGSNARSIAEYILSSLFVLADQHDFKLKDKTVGVIGCGEAGSRVVDMLETIGVRCIMNDPPLKDALGNDQSACEKYRDLQELLSADIITLHVPLTEEGPYPTQKLVDADFLDKLNDDVILINTARGGVIDATALKNHLACHSHMNVVLDVWKDEPDIDLDLLNHVAIGTPHIAGYSTDGKIRATQMIFESMCTFFKLDAEWQAMSALPNGNLLGGNSLELPLSTDIDDEDAIQMAILASYDVRSDSVSLRRLPEIEIEQRGHYFDELRKNYPVRREFSATVIHLPERKKTLVGKLKRLGFVVKQLS